MKVTVVFDKNTHIIVPCGDGKLPIYILAQRAIERYIRHITNHSQPKPTNLKITELKTEHGAFLDMYDDVIEVVEDKERIFATLKSALTKSKSLHNTSIIETQRHQLKINNPLDSQSVSSICTNNSQSSSGVSSTRNAAQEIYFGKKFSSVAKPFANDFYGPKAMSLHNLSSSLTNDNANQSYVYNNTPRPFSTVQNTKMVRKKLFETSMNLSNVFEGEKSVQPSSTMNFQGCWNRIV